MKNKKIRKMFLFAVILVLSSLLLVACGGGGAKSGGDTAKKETPKFPEKDISVIVPFNPGGSTDLTARALANEMSAKLGVKMPVANNPGASGSVGTKAVLNAKADGYTILANGLASFVAQNVMGLSVKTYKDWHIWPAPFTPNVIAVAADSPYKTIDELIAAMKKDPGKITAGTAGDGTGGHIGIELIKSVTGISYKHVPYQGGNPAIVATLSKEVDFTPQLLVEMFDMIRSGKLRALACLSEEDIVLEGNITIPSITKSIPELKKMLPMGETTGILVPKAVPEESLKKIDEAVNAAVASDAFKTFCKTKGFIIINPDRSKSQESIGKLASVVSWTLFNAGVAKESPEKFQIPKQ